LPTPPVRVATRGTILTRCTRKHGPKTGNRVIKSKKASRITQDKIKKKSSAGLVGQTEKLLAEKAGHLEMLKGGKRDKKNAEGKKKVT